MSDLTCYLATFNCGRALANVDYFAANFFDGLKTNVPPDLVVLSLQEIAPIASSFLGGSFLAPYFARFVSAIHTASAKRFDRETEYESVIIRNVGMTAILVFAKGSIQERVRWIETAGVGFGAWDMGNKGAVAARIALESDERDGKDTVLTFVGAHLAPMEDAWEARNGDWKKLCEGLVFEKDGTTNKALPDSDTGSESDPLLSPTAGDIMAGDEQSLFSPTSHIFFLGDLNYRASDTGPTPGDTESWPQPVDNVSDVHHYSHLLKSDQLNRERSKGKTLHKLDEAEINFPPTYKYSDAAQKHVAQFGSTKASSEDEVWLWAKHRTPSWCDRILFLEAAPPNVSSYTALPVQPTSDHRPVVLSCSVSGKPITKAPQDVNPPFPIKKDWRAARDTARRYEYIVGLAAYLTLTWEGEALLAGTCVGLVSGYLVLRALIGT